MSSRRVYPMARDAVERERTKHDLEYCTYFSGERREEKKSNPGRWDYRGEEKRMQKQKPSRRGILGWDLSWVKRKAIGWGRNKGNEIEVIKFTSSETREV